MKVNWGWLIAGILLAIILWLIFRPVPKVDNSAAIKTIDSLRQVNNGLRKSLEGTIQIQVPVIDSLKKANDSLQETKIKVEIRLDRARATETQLARLIQELQDSMKKQPFDSACLELAQRVIDDSIVIKDYQANGQKIINNFSRIVQGNDSIISAQSKLIFVDSVLINHQRALLDIQTKQLKTSQNRAKISAWLARSLAVVSLVLGGILLSK